MDSENREGKALSFSVDGRDVKNRNKRNYNSLLEYKKTLYGANWDFKATTSKVRGGWNRWDMQLVQRAVPVFYPREESGQEKSYPSMWKLAYVCWPRTEAGYQQNKIKWEFAAIFSFILVIPKHHLLVRQAQYHKFSLKCLSPGEN